MRLIILIIALFLVLPASACTDCCPNPVIANNITISNILSQVQWMTQQQSQQQQQEQQQIMNAPGGTQSSWINSNSDGNYHQAGIGIEQESQTYSRLLYPSEVIPFPVKPGQNCTVLSGLPIAFYTINSGNGTYDLMVQTLTAIPSYDPIYHRMEFGQVPVVNKIDYWTMKARIQATPESDFCVVDNRAPFNGYTTIEVTIK